MKTVYKYKYKDWGGWIDHEKENCGWYSKIRYDLGLLIDRRNMEEGNTGFESIPMSQDDLTKIVQWLMHIGTIPAIVQALILVTNYHAIGRTGEIAALLLKNCYWDADNCCLVVMWYMAKVTDNKVSQNFLNIFLYI